MQLKVGFIKNISRNIKGVILPELNLGMKRNLWGLTLWVWSYTLQMAFINLIDDKPIAVLGK